MDIKRGDIYWIKKNPHKPSIGFVQEAERPAIIVSNNTANKNAYIFEVVYLTTSPKKDLPTHVTIKSTPQTSTALCEQITTISDEQISNYIGKCSTAEMMAIEQAMLISLGIDIITLDQNQAEPEPQEEHHMTPAERDMDDMHIQLVQAQKEAEIYQKLYTDLLQKTLDR